MEKIKIAFVKFGGLSAGGTEKWLQITAANLDKERFDVDYYYCDTAPYIGDDTYAHPGTDEVRKKYMEENGINLIEFHVGAKDITTPTHEWIDTDFWEKFDEKKYDIVQTGRAGHSEYPFCMMKQVPIVDSLHLSGMVDNQYNISRVMHICKWNADAWTKAGGDKKRVVFVSHPIIVDHHGGNFRSEFGLGDKFIYGFHQRNDDEIFSHIPLEAYRKIESENTYFLILGGGQKYREQAESLGIKNIAFLGHASDPKVIYRFLATLDVYAHGRKDGEVNSTAMAEALYFGLPIVSHYSEINNGHVECIGKAGKVVRSPDEYVVEILKLNNDNDYYEFRSLEAKKRFKENYELQAHIDNVTRIYEDVIRRPFPNKLRRWWFRYMNSFSAKAIRNRILRRLLRICERALLLTERVSGSYRRHNADYVEEGALEREREAYEKYDKSKHLSEPSIALDKLLRAHPDVNCALVDIGSGSGWLSSRKSDYFKHVFAIEPSEEVLEIAKKLAGDGVHNNITWINGFAERELKKIELDEPAVFVTLTVLSHLPDRSVRRICEEVDRIAQPGSLICFAECWGDTYHIKMWHVRSREWWCNVLPGWEIDFHGPNIEGVEGRSKGFHAVKRG